MAAALALCNVLTSFTPESTKDMKTVLKLIILVFAYVSLPAHAQVQTLTVSPSNTNSAVLNVSSNSFAIIKSAYTASGGSILVNMQGVNFTFNLSFQTVSGLTFAGPATIQLQGDSYGAAFATFAIEPGPFPPGQALTVGSNSGNVQVTMQTSTDLVNWTTAVNGMVYTNTPAARFFRIQLLTNAQNP